MSAGTDMRTSRAKVRGLGSAKSGTEHFISQRVSAIGLAVLTPFFIIPFVQALGQPWEEVISIYKSPMNAIIAAMFLFLGFAAVFSVAMIAFSV